MTLLVTGGAGFIGANLIRWLLAETRERLVNLDSLTYAANQQTVDELAREERHLAVCGDVRNTALVSSLLAEHLPRAVIHLAAETHVDRSVHDPGRFVEANVVGTYSLLEACRLHLLAAAAQAERFRLLVVSTDEVYGSLADGQGSFDESTRTDPSSPYSATKAGADHLARAYGRTFGLPVIITHGSNTYGPYQHPEKLIPLIITKALAGEALPLYGDGLHRRDWLHVEDHCRGLWAALERGEPGRSYNLGSGAERANIDLVRALCALLDRLAPPAENSAVSVDRYSELIHFVRDRPGHDFRYALDTRRAARELGWRPRWSPDAGLEATVRWYLEHPGWLRQASVISV